MKFRIFLVLLLGFVSSHPHSNEDVNSEEAGGFVEGDMIFTEQQLAELNTRTGLVNVKYRWPNKIIPYVFLAGHFSKIKI